MFLQLFGVPSWRIGRRNTPLTASKPSSLLLYVAAHPNGVLREEVSQILWGDSPNARSSLRQALQQLGQHPLGVYLKRHDQQLQLEVNSDWAAFWQAQSKGQDQHLALIAQKPLFAGYSPSGANDFEDWMFLTRTKVHQLWQEATLRLAENAVREQQWSEAFLRYSQVLERDTLAEAVLQRALTVADLAAQPEIGQQMLRQYAGLAKRQFEITVRPKSDFSLSSSPLFGREAVIEQVLEILNTNSTCTLVGLGGVGKTRLCLAVAQAWQAPVIHVWLGNTNTPNALVIALCTALGLSGTNLEPRLEATLGKQNCLLVLDNCETLNQAAREQLAQYQALGGKWLLSSREPLGFVAEKLVRLEGLPLAASEQLLQHNLRRSGVLATPRSSEIVQLHQYCAGLPLALELLAGLLQYMDAPTLLARLKKAEHGKLLHSSEEVLHTSWARLSNLEQDVLAALSLLPQAAPLEVVENVAQTNLVQLERLCWCGFARQDQLGYFGLHPLVRQFAAPYVGAAAKQRLAAYGASWLERQFARYYSPAQLEVLQQCREHSSWLEQAFLQGVTLGHTQTIHIFVLFADACERFTQALECIKQALELMPSALLYCARAWFYLRLANLENAKSDLETAALMPDFAHNQAYSETSLLYCYAQSDYQGVLEWANNSLAKAALRVSKPMLPMLTGNLGNSNVPIKNCTMRFASRRNTPTRAVWHGCNCCWVHLRCSKGNSS